MFANLNHEDFLAENQNEADKALLVKFYLKPRQDKAESAKAGRPIYKDVEYIDIQKAGDQTRSGASRPATDADKQRFGKHYEMFKQRMSEDEQVVGTLLSEWPQIPRSKVEELKFFNIRTVENLAHMADNHAQQMLGLFELKARAKAWLAAAEGSKDLLEVHTQLEAMNKKLGDLMSHNEQLEKSNAQLEDKVSELVIKSQPIDDKTQKRKPVKSSE